MKRETLLKTIVAVLALTSATAAWAQTTAYERWCEARNQMAAYKQMTPKAATIKRPWYADWQSLKYTPSANGTGTIFIWDGGLGVRYDYSAVNTTAWDHADNRTRPTGSTTLTLTATGITIKTYNDVQLNTTFDEATGAPRRPSDPYREYFGCSGGTAQRNLMFVVGRTRYDAKASVTCRHSHKVISVSRGGWNRNRTAYHGGRTTNPEGDFITPQKFMHTQTISIPYATLAKAAGMTEKELFQAILDNGLTHLQCQGFVTDTGDSSERGYLLNHINDLLGQMLTIVAAQKCGATEATMKEAFLQHASAATLAGMERRGTATDELRSHGSELLAYSGDYESQLLGAELKLMCLYRYQQLFNDYTALYEHFQQTGKTDLLSKLRVSRLKVMEQYDQMLNAPDQIFQQQYAAAKQRFEAARKTDPDASLRQGSIFAMAHSPQVRLERVLLGWSKPSFTYTAEMQLNTGYRHWHHFEESKQLFKEATSLGDDVDMFVPMVDSLASMLRTGIALHMSAKQEYLRRYVNDGRLGEHLLNAASQAHTAIWKLHNVFYYHRAFKERLELLHQVSHVTAGQEQEIRRRINSEEQTELDQFKQLAALFEKKGVTPERLQQAKDSLSSCMRTQIQALYCIAKNIPSERDVLKPYYSDDSRDVVADYFSFIVNLQEYVPEIRYDAGYRNFLTRLLHGLALVDIQMGNDDSALKRFAQALSIGEDYDKSLYTVTADDLTAKCKTLGCVSNVYIRRQDYDAAMDYNEQALALHSATYPNDLARKGVILVAKGETKEAMRLWKKLNSDYPDGNWNNSLFHKSLVEKQLIEP